MTLQSGPADPERLGGYEILGRLGTGGQGVVYLGRPLTGPGQGAVSGPGQVAIKLLHAQMIESRSARARFVRELALLRRVAGFCTAQVIEADLAGDQPYIVSEYIPGPSLRELVHDRGPRTGADLDRLAISSVTALTAIHRAGIVHRDFKPQNVLMGPDGPRVIDFGIARALDPGATVTNQIVGTPAYMAPEQFTGTDIGPSADLFAWAATLLFAATGRDPFAGGPITAVMYRVLNHAPDLTVLPAQIAEVAAEALSKDPEGRPTAEQALLRLLGERTTPNRPPPTQIVPPNHGSSAQRRPDRAAADQGPAGQSLDVSPYRADPAGTPTGHPVGPPNAAGRDAGSSTEAATDQPAQETAATQHGYAPPETWSLPPAGQEAVSTRNAGGPGYAPPAGGWHHQGPAAPGGNAGRPYAGYGQAAGLGGAPSVGGSAGSHPRQGSGAGRQPAVLRRGAATISGLAIAGALAVLDVLSLAVFVARPDLTSGTGGGWLLLVASSFVILAIATLVGVILALRGSRAAAWTVLTVRVLRIPLWAAWTAIPDLEASPTAIAGYAGVTALTVVLLAFGLRSR